MERRHRDAARMHRPQIRSLRWPGFASLDADPVIRLAARIEPVLDAQKVWIALALTGDRHALHLAGFAIREIDVQHHALRPAGFEQLLHQPGAMAHRRVPNRLTGLVLADGEAE